MILCLIFKSVVDQKFVRTLSFDYILSYSTCSCKPDALQKNDDICVWRTECWLWSFSSNVSSVPLGKWLSSFTRASKPNFCRENTHTDRLRPGTSECIQCFWVELCLCLYLFYEIKTLSIVHPVDIIPDQSFSMNTNTQKEIKWQRIRCSPCALVTFEVRFVWWCVECVCLYILKDILVVLKLL